MVYNMLHYQAKIQHVIEDDYNSEPIEDIMNIRLSANNGKKVNINRIYNLKNINHWSNNCLDFINRCIITNPK